MKSRQRKRASFSITQKQEMLRYQDHAKASQQSIAGHFALLWEYDVKRRTGSDILQQREKFISVDTLIKTTANSKTNRPGTSPFLVVFRYAPQEWQID